MIIGRIIGLLLLCLMIMVGGAETIRYLEGDTEGWISIIQFADILEMYRISFLSNLMELNTNPEGMGRIVAMISGLSALFIFMVSGLGLTFFSSMRYHRT